MKKFKKNQSVQNYQSIAFVFASVAGIVNLSSFFLLYSFASNITGYFAMIAEEATSKKWFQVFVVLAWISLFFVGSAVSATITHLKQFHRSLIINYLPIIIIVSILFGVSIYGQFYYDESIQETELILGALLFAMGVQNGFSASISNLVVKNTHLTGATTDLAVLIGRRFFWENNPEGTLFVKQRLKLVALTISGYVFGATIGGTFVRYFGFWTLAVAALFLLFFTLLFGLSPYFIRWKYRVFSRTRNVEIFRKSLESLGD